MQSFANFLNNPADHRVAWHQQRYYHFAEFRQQVWYWQQQFQAQPVKQFALFSEDAYPFSVLLFALLAANKQVWIAHNNRPATAQFLTESGCQLLGDWQQTFDYQLAARATPAAHFAPLSLVSQQLLLLTSASTGPAKLVAKSLQQLETELHSLEKLWGNKLANCEIAATVSHQHLYGLLFRLLWPLLAGHCFTSQTALNPEILLRKPNQTVWVASPAHLKRLNQASAWQALAKLRLIFSSGGVLTQAVAEQIQTLSGQQVIEIYGSTETGGIAWRQSSSADWDLFPGLSLQTKGSSVCLSSPYLPDSTCYELDDSIELNQNGRFKLLGRRDAIVKIEDNRLSLTAMESELNQIPTLENAIAFKLNQGRELIAIALQLSESGQQFVADYDRKVLIKQLKQQLSNTFSASLLPRRWLIFNTLPLTPAGKPDKALLNELFNLDPNRYPQLQTVKLTENTLELDLQIGAELVYFPNHFQNHPLLPGVILIGWADYFGRLLLPIRAPFAEMDMIKFIKPVLPSSALSLKLEWQSAKSRVCFNYSHDQQVFSSGRLRYRMPQ